MDKITKNKVVIGVAIVAAILGCYFFFFQSESNQAGDDPVFSELSQEEREIPKEDAAKEPVIIKVDVKGAVRTPGVYMAKSGDRVIDVIAAAGDFTKEANLDKVNLAQLVEDQMVIYIPKKGEEGEESIVGSLSTPTGEIASIGNEGSAGNALVNINTATQAELETLTGIGPSKAIAIIEYRETTGKYQQKEDLKNIPGIGDKTFEKLRDSITVK